MKKADIVTGSTYFDGKNGVRYVDSIVDGSVMFTILAAKQEQEYNSESKSMQSVIGTKGQSLSQSFASWASVKVNDDKVQFLIHALKAQRTKFSPLEVLLLKELAQKDLESAEWIFNYTTDQKRVVTGLDKKGIFSILHSLARPRASVTAFGRAALHVFAGRELTF